ncbi:MAG: M20/M25/M40 family metallo-hydrolase, partial [Ruminococcus sp.]|nr:M20/M25/M40 family metallo-hydrolase [Ruminococcus sp.]
MYKRQISKYFDDHFDEILASLKEIMSIDSTFQTPKENMPFGEGSAKALKWGADFGQSLGMKVKNFDNYAVSMDFKDGNPKLGILSHLDVVPASEGWHYPPFDCTVDGDNIYGRGAIDDKGPSVA